MVSVPLYSALFALFLRLVEAVQVGPGARLREAKCLMEVVRLVMIFRLLRNCMELRHDPYVVT